MPKVNKIDTVKTTEKAEIEGSAGKKNRFSEKEK